MTDSSERFPPARIRTRALEAGPADAAAALAVAAGDDGPAEPPIDSAFELTDYLSHHEAGAAFSDLQAGLEAALAPRDFVERLWVDEVITAEWEGHRLRAAKKMLLDRGLAKALESRWHETPNGRIGFNTGYIPVAARGVVEGDAQSLEAAVSDFGRNPMEQPQRLLAEGYLARLNDQLELEKAIKACGQRRDAILTRLYGRRELLRSQSLAQTPAAGG